MTQDDLGWLETKINDSKWLKMSHYEFRWLKSTAIALCWGPSDLDISIYSRSVTSERETTTLCAYGKLCSPNYVTCQCKQLFYADWHFYFELPPMQQQYHLHHWSCPHCRRSWCHHSSRYFSWTGCFIWKVSRWNALLSPLNAFSII